MCICVGPAFSSIVRARTYALLSCAHKASYVSDLLGINNSSVGTETLQLPTWAQPTAHFSLVPPLLRHTLPRVAIAEAIHAGSDGVPTRSEGEGGAHVTLPPTHTLQTPTLSCCCVAHICPHTPLWVTVTGSAASWREVVVIWSTAIALDASHPRLAVTLSVTSALQRGRPLLVTVAGHAACVRIEVVIRGTHVTLSASETIPTGALSGGGVADGAERPLRVAVAVCGRNKEEDVDTFSLGVSSLIDEVEVVEEEEEEEKEEEEERKRRS